MASNDGTVLAEAASMGQQGWFRWVSSSLTHLAKVERRIMQSLKSKLVSQFVFLPQSQNRLWTVSANPGKGRTPLVMIHGMAGGVGLWAQNIDSLCTKRPLHAFDLLGFGRSSRPKFSKKAELAETEFVESVEEWRKEMQLDKMVLLGHSLGAFIASSYALKYPERIQHLILVDPWGFEEKPPDNESIPRWARVIITLVQPFNPLAIIRAAGPWGPGLVKKFRPDLKEKFSDLFDDDTIFEYIYHCNAQKPSGETAFKALSMSFGWAKQPMIKRVGQIQKSIPMTFIHGSESWISPDTSYTVKYIRKDSYVDVQVINGAGHHVYADQPQAFNHLVKKILDNIDSAKGNESSQSNPLADRGLPCGKTDLESVPITLST